MGVFTKGLKIFVFCFLIDGSTTPIALSQQEIRNKINKRLRTIFFSFKFSFQEERYYLFLATGDKNFLNLNSTEG